jgi:SpoVK/Ycf46/Vps4 family AAA+-type ATPase
MLCAHSGPVLIGSDEPWLPRSPHRARRVRWINFPAPEFVQRRDYLGHLLNGLENDDALDVEGLAGRFVLTTGQMNDLVASALDRATQQERGLVSDDLFAAAREHSSPRLSSLARKLTPRYAFDDLILPDDQIARLRELVLMVEGRAQVLDEWGLGRKLAPSYGITALFAGGPGTGKTMAAEVIARQLGLDVYKIDLSGLVSKYIGETEKNLEKVFSEAESSNAILFFDEADAIFGKRSEVKDAHDRYANIETSYLLQRMEAYDGVTILATNLRANLDEAFTRRLHAVVDFPFPDAEQRLRIWKALFPASVPASDTVDLETLARRYKIAGGSIRNVLVSASYFASAAKEPMGMAHLLHATRRELQKLGRLTDERDFVATR